MYVCVIETKKGSVYFHSFKPKICAGFAAKKKKKE